MRSRRFIVCSLYTEALAGYWKVVSCSLEMNRCEFRQCTAIDQFVPCPAAHLLVFRVPSRPVPSRPAEAVCKWFTGVHRGQCIGLHGVSRRDSRIRFQVAQVQHMGLLSQRCACKLRSCVSWNDKRKIGSDQQNCTTNRIEYSLY